MKRIVFILFCLAAVAAPTVFAVKVQLDPWKNWLDDVAPIMTRLEKQTVKFLTTEEDRQRFQESFWKVRDPDPTTSVNEFKNEYYRRVEYARKNLNGQFSDRGKIYLLLGKPLEVKDFSGNDDLVDCQLWSYQDMGPMSPASFINLLFFRYHNIGDYQIYYPGIHKPMDLLAPYAASRHRTVADAYQTLLSNSAELAQASLSVIPGEGDPDLTPSAGTSGLILADIYSLPEKQVETQYLQNFRTPQGKVTVVHSTNEIHGKLTWAVSRQNDLHFINYAFIPDFIGLTPFSPDTQHAELIFYLTAVDAQGQTVFQDNHKLDLKLPKAKLEGIMEKKLLFQDFFPIIPGTFSVTLTCINQSSGEFFSQSQELIVAPERPVILFGFDNREISDSKRYQPFTAGQQVILNDPRGLYAAQDSLVGIIESEAAPEVILADAGGEKKTIVVLSPASSQGRLYFYRYELKDLAAGNYILQVRQKGSLLLSLPVFLMPAYMKVKRPSMVEKISSFDSQYNFWFIIGQEYLNHGEADNAIRFFSLLPAEQLTGQSLPVIARAYYQKRNFARVLELLEKECVEKNYSNLLLLANSSIELKSFAKASKYLEALRNYGDTAEISRLLAAAYLTQGDSKKARFYYDHARLLDEQAQSASLLPEKSK